MRLWLSVCIAFTFAPFGAMGQDANLRPRQGALRVGDPAPNFELKSPDEKQSVKLSSLRGKPVVLLFGSCT